MSTLTVLTPKPAVFSATVGDETVLYDEERGMYFGLNAVASRVWQLVTEGQSIESIRASVEQEFDVSAERLAGDLAKLLDDLTANGLLASSPRST